MGDDGESDSVDPEAGNETGKQLDHGQMSQCVAHLKSAILL